MNTTTKKRSDPYRSTFHRNGDVTLWDCFQQQWVRLDAAEVSDRTLATLPWRERNRIIVRAAKINKSLSR